MGHPTAIFLTPPDPNYKCAICLDVFDDPVSLLQCGHTFCRSCVDSSLRQSGRNCPECRAEIDVDADDGNNEIGGGSGNVVHSVRVVRCAIGNSLVCCRNCLDENGESTTNDAQNTAINADVATTRADRNDEDDDVDDDGDDGASQTPRTAQCCNWTGPLSQWPLHASRHCPIALVTCPVPGCSHHCTRARMKSHVGSPACVEAAAVSRVESLANVFLSDLEERAKEEAGRRAEALEAEKTALEARVRCEAKARSELRGANRALRREVKRLKKRVAGHDQRRREQMAAVPQMPMTMPQNNAVVGTDGSASTVQREGNVRRDNKKRKKNKKRKRGQEQGRMRAVSLDSIGEDDV